EAIRHALKRAGIEGGDVNDVVMGHCRQAGNFVNPAHTAAAKGGIPYEVPSGSLNMAWPAGMRALYIASQEVRLQEAAVVMAVGFESMSTIPYLLRGARFDGFKMGPKTLDDGWSDSNDPVHDFMGMGETAENVAEKYGITRDAMDAFALESHRKATTAQDEGWFDEELAPIEVPAKKGQTIHFDKDESVRRDSTVEKLGKLPTVFRKGGCVTAGNACGMTDGAVALVVTSREKAKALGAKPLFHFLGFAQVAVDGRTMGEGPSISIPLALQQAGKTLQDMDALEVNEAFASQVLANEQVLQWDREKLNRHGGAIALGHPTGISGSRIVWTLYNVLKIHGGELGVAGICGGGGVTMACVIRREA
ncbi:MAG: thiolase family protein, partial [Planctomycetota bacterium]